MFCNLIQCMTNKENKFKKKNKTNAINTKFLTLLMLKSIYICHICEFAKLPLHRSVYILHDMYIHVV